MDLFPYPGTLALLLADIDAVAGVVLLHLHGLHLLLDRLHGGAGVGEEREELQGVGARLRSSLSKRCKGSISGISTKKGCSMLNLIDKILQNHL